jgi:hypothetical protein
MVTLKSRWSEFSTAPFNDREEISAILNKIYSALINMTEKHNEPSGDLLKAGFGFSDFSIRRGTF